MKPFYYTLRLYKEGGQDIKLHCPECKHVTSHHLYKPKHNPVKTVVRCWYCRQVTWIVTILVDKD